MTRGPGRPFTPEEDAVLKRQYKAGKLVRLIALDLGRQTSSVSDRIKRLQLGDRIRPRENIDVKIRMPRKLLAALDRSASFRETTRARFVRLILERAVAEQ